MIVWNEESDRYLLTVNRWEEVAFWSLVAVLSAVPLILLEATSRRRDVESLTCCAIVFVPLGLVAVRKAVGLVRERGWIEVPLRGGAVRWGYPGAPRMDQPVRVKMFAVLDLPLGDATVAVILLNEAHVRALGKWRSRHTGRVRAAVRQLNDLMTPSLPAQGSPDARPPEGGPAEGPALP
ncbi:MAG: hypothetical protein AAB434_09530 [Planctomycetota bacterium]